MSGNDILREAGASESRGTQDETIEFRRETVRAQTNPQQNMEHTAQIRGGAVVRPLKQQSAPQSSTAGGAASKRLSPIQAAAQRQQQAAVNQQSERRSQPTQAQPHKQSTQPKTQSQPQVQPTARPTINRTQPTQAQSRTQSVQQVPQVQPQQRTNVQNVQRSVPQNSRTSVNAGVQRPVIQERSVPAQKSTGNNVVQRQLQGTPPVKPQLPTVLGAEKAPANMQSQQHAVVPVQKTRVRTENDDFEIDEVATASHRQRKKQYSESRIADSATSAVMSLVKAVIYIVVIIAVSVGLSVFVINTANDVFKFVVDEKIVTVEIPEYASIEDVADALYDSGAIKYKWAFNFWSGLKDSGAEFIPGTYEVSTTLNYDYLRASFKKSTKRTELRITIPEGYTVDEIIELLIDSGIGNVGESEEKRKIYVDAFVDVINNHAFDYRFLEGLQVTEDRIYRLEGYLFPDTYNFYAEYGSAEDSDTEAARKTAVSVVSKLLDNFDSKFVDEYYDRCTDLGMTVDQAMILASMVEKETRYADELGYVSSVFHNRLKYSGSFPYLNSDATIMYAIAHETGSRLDTMTGEDTSYDTPYNTYTHRGLPPGPIANPGLNAIKYALYPNDTNYFYFVSDSAGRTLFATTEAEHLANINAVRGN